MKHVTWRVVVGSVREMGGVGRLMRVLCTKTGDVVGCVRETGDVASCVHETGDTAGSVCETRDVAGSVHQTGGLCTYWVSNG